MASRRGRQASFDKQLRLAGKKERYQVGLMRRIGRKRFIPQPPPHDPEMAALAEFIHDVLVRANIVYAEALATERDRVNVEKVAVDIKLRAPSGIGREEYERHTNYYASCISPRWLITPTEVEGHPGWTLERAS